MDDERLKNRVRQAFDERQTSAPADFDTTWAAATARHRRARRNYTTAAGVATAAALVVAVIGFMSSNESRVTDEYLIADALMNSTRWSAPSDVLMPEHRFDIYRELPSFYESTDTQDGTLL